MDPAFKKIAAVEIEEFKREYALRYPGRSADELTDEDLLREVMNTIGKKGRLGEQLRCVVSVSMLTEGWDATTVTHILGVRAFGTQLLCEQVVGRGLRRISYEADKQGMFEPEYAEVYGVPFSFIPAVGTDTPPVIKQLHRVRALPERAALEITFPRLLGYRYDLPTEHLDAEFAPGSVMVLATDEVPTLTEVDPIVGEKTVHRLDDLRARRLQEVAFRIARRILDDKFRDPDGFPQGWLFPQLVGIAERWLGECVVLKDDAFPQMLLLAQLEADAADRIYRAIVTGTIGEKRLQPILRPYDAIGSTRFVDFDTTKQVYPTEKSHLNYLVLDSLWEAKVGQTLDAMDEVRGYAKNQGLNFKIPYTFEGAARNYVPDLLVRIDDVQADPLNLIIEVTGEHRKEKAAKVAAARDLWVPAVTNQGGLGRWSFLEVSDPWDAEHLIRAHIRDLTAGRLAPTRRR